jgi:phosphotransferase system  glucose/maltose/N-acetylglucosamine-specific IIC component
VSHRNEFSQLIRGILLVFIMHIAAIIIGAILLNILSSIISPLLSGHVKELFDKVISALVGILLASLFFIGFAQLVYVIPVCIWLKRRQKRELMKGVIIGAVITPLLNGGCCYGYILQDYK